MREVYKVNAIFNNEKIQSSFESLIFNEDNIVYNELIMKTGEIENIDILMCSSQVGVNMAYYLT